MWRVLTDARLLEQGGGFLDRPIGSAPPDERGIRIGGAARRDISRLRPFSLRRRFSTIIYGWPRPRLRGRFVMFVGIGHDEGLTCPGEQCGEMPDLYCVAFVIGVAGFFIGQHLALYRHFSQVNRSTVAYDGQMMVGQMITGVWYFSARLKP
jgi:hypothetical protein